MTEQEEFERECATATEVVRQMAVVFRERAEIVGKSSGGNFLLAVAHLCEAAITWGAPQGIAVAGTAAQTLIELGESRIRDMASNN